MITAKKGGSLPAPPFRGNNFVIKVNWFPRKLSWGECE